ncbi:MAG: glycosyltransferase [Candidatus Omnitrophica bacterium]|nr:glycosyltransferase [Candidatus Omnitrophota bacterium]
MIDYKKTISILTVSYNQGEFIEQTIKSVIFQDGDFFIEYLIVDGGSTDNTLEILKKYKNLIENKKIKINCLGIDFKFISEKDEGPTNALNKGLRVLKGNIIGILNSDDIYAEGSFKKVIKAFQLNPKTEIVYGDVIFIDERGNYIYLKKGKKILKLKDFFQENPIIQPETFIKKTVFEKIGFFDENFKFANDYDFWIRCIKNNINFKYIHYPLVYFRKRKGARSSSSNPLIFVDTLKVQFKHFGITDFFLKNLGIYSSMFSNELGKDFDYGFEEILKLLFKEIRLNLNKNMIKKAKSFGYLKYAIYKIYEDKKYGMKSYFKSIINYPQILFTKNNLIFLVRIFLMKGKIYYGLKTFLKINKK